jgi:hypothetical protein
VPSGAFLVAVSMLERRADRTEESPAAAADNAPAVPVASAVPVAAPAPASAEPPSTGRPAAELVEFARRVAAEHERTHGQPISGDSLRARLGVSDQLASTLLRELTTA